MSQPHMDNNDLARFLDARLSEEERSSTVAHLSESDQDAELLADAAYLLRDLEGEDAGVVDVEAHAGHPHADEVDTGTDPKVVPLRPPSTARRPWRRAPARWLALAAVLAGVLLVPFALSRSRGPSGPGEFAVLLADPQAGLPENWTSRYPWGGTRGGGGEAIIDNTLAARLGALQTDLEVAARAGQAEETEALAADIVEMLDMPGSAGVAAAYRDIGERAGQPWETLAAPVAEARGYLIAFVDEDHFNLGAWAEAARIAARSRDAAFFRARASRKMLDRAASLDSLDDGTRATVDAIRAAAEADQPDWTVLAAQTDALLGQIGR